MQIKNLTANRLFLGFVGNHGTPLEGNATITVSDKYSGNPSLGAMIDDGLVTATGFDASDSYGTEPDYVTAAEFNATKQGLYVVADDWSSTGAPTASATGEALTGTSTGPFDTTSKWVLRFLFDSLNEVTVILPRGQIDISTLVDALNNDANFAMYGLAADDGGGQLQVTSKAVGTNSRVEFVDDIRNAISQVGMDNATVTAATGDIAVIEINTHNTVGGGLAGITHAIKLFTTDVGGGSTVSSEFVIQRVENGVIESGLGTAEVTIRSGADGGIKFEVAAPGAITEAQDWVGVVLPATHYFAQVPAARLQVV